MEESKIVLSAKEYQALLNKYYNPPTRSAGNLSVKQFFELMYYMLDIEKPGLIFAPAFPAHLIPTTPEYKKTMENPTDNFVDTITYVITRQEPGSFGGDKQPFGDRREVVPRIRQEDKTTHPDKGSIVYGQWFDILVQFDLWTLTNFQAEDLALWFQRFMTTHRQFMKHMGLSEILFWWRGRDEVASNLKNNLHVRSIVFFIRTEELMAEEEFKLKELQIKLDNIMK